MNTRHDEQHWAEMAAKAEAGEFRPTPGGEHLTGEAAAAAGRALIQHGYGTTDPNKLHRIITGRPSLSSRADGISGRSPKRQVRLPQDLNDWLETYADAHGQTVSEVMRNALERYRAAD